MVIKYCIRRVAFSEQARSEMLISSCFVSFAPNNGRMHRAIMASMARVLYKIFKQNLFLEIKTKIISGRLCISA